MKPEKREAFEEAVRRGAARSGYPPRCDAREDDHTCTLAVGHTGRHVDDGTHHRWAAQPGEHEHRWLKASSGCTHGCSVTASVCLDCGAAETDGTEGLPQPPADVAGWLRARAKEADSFNEGGLGIEAGTLRETAAAWERTRGGAR